MPNVGCVRNKSNNLCIVRILFKLNFGGKETTLTFTPTTVLLYYCTLSAKWITMKERLDILGFWKCSLLEWRPYSFWAQFWSVPFGTCVRREPRKKENQQGRGRKSEETPSSSELYPGYLWQEQHVYSF